MFSLGTNVFLLLRQKKANGLSQTKAVMRVFFLTAHMIFFLYITSLFMACSQPLNKVSTTLSNQNALPTKIIHSTSIESAVTGSKQITGNDSRSSPKKNIVHIEHTKIIQKKEASRNIASRNTASRNIASRNIASRNITSRNIASRNIASKNIASRNIESSLVNNLKDSTDLSPPYFKLMPPTNDIDENHFFYHDKAENEVYDGITTISANTLLLFNGNQSKYQENNHSLLDEGQKYYSLGKKSQKTGDTGIYNGGADIDNQSFINAFYAPYVFKEENEDIHYAVQAEYSSIEIDIDHSNWLQPALFSEAFSKILNEEEPFDFSSVNKVASAKVVSDKSPIFAQKALSIKPSKLDHFKEELLQLFYFDWLMVVPTLMQSNDPQYQHCKNIYTSIREGDFEVISPQKIHTENYNFWRQILNEASLIQDHNAPLTLFILKQNKKVFHAFSTVFEVNGDFSTIMPGETKPQHYFHGLLVFDADNNKKSGSVGRFYKENKIGAMKIYVVYWKDTYYHLRVTYHQSSPSKIEITPLFFTDQLSKRNCRWKI